MVDLFELIKIMFEDPIAYNKISNGTKKKHFFMLNRRFSIFFPLQAQILQHTGIDEISVVDFWQSFIRKQYSKVPNWMYVKGVKKVTEEKEKKSNISEASIKEFSIAFNYDIKIVKEAIAFFPDEMKKEINDFDKIRNS